MKGFRRIAGVVSEHFSAYEVGLLVSMVEQLIDLVDAPEVPADVDAFERLQTEWEHPLQHDDPALARLFPAAYGDDEAAEADFRRYTEPGLRARKAAEARLVLGRLLESEEGKHATLIADEEIDAWLKTLNSLRLILAVRLGLEDPDAAEFAEELPEDHPQAFLVNIYEWLGFALETLLDCLP